MSDEPNQTSGMPVVDRSPIWSPTMELRWRAPSVAALSVQPDAKVLEQKFVDVSLYGGGTRWMAVPMVFEP